MPPTEKLKQSLYFSDDVLREIMAEANRLDRSLSWTVQQAWRIAREEVRKFPGVDRGPREPLRAPVRAAPPAPPQRPAADQPREPSEQVREFLRGKFDRDTAS